MSEPRQPGEWPSGFVDVMHDTLVVALDALLWPESSMIFWTRRADDAAERLKEVGAVVTCWGGPSMGRLIARPPLGKTWDSVREAALALRVALKLAGTWDQLGE